MPDPCDPAPAPAPPPAGPIAIAAPYTAAELRAVWRHPDHAFEFLLARRDRLAASIAGGDTLWQLVLVLVACTVLASIPYGFVRGSGSWWKIGVLFGGSVCLCFPSLQVFGAYLGSRLRPTQNVALALVISSVAALFTLGFFPILWFLGQTMMAGDWIDANVASIVMLGAALAAGLAQLLRLVRHDQALLPSRSVALLVAWQLLVLFVTLRMARALELLR